MASGCSTFGTALKPLGFAAARRGVLPRKAHQRAGWRRRFSSAFSASLIRRVAQTRGLRHAFRAFRLRRLPNSLACMLVAVWSTLRIHAPMLNRSARHSLRSAQLLPSAKPLFQALYPARCAARNECARVEGIAVPALRKVPAGWTSVSIERWRSDREERQAFLVCDGARLELWIHASRHCETLAASAAQGSQFSNALLSDALESLGCAHGKRNVDGRALASPARMRERRRKKGELDPTETHALCSAL